MASRLDGTKWQMMEMGDGITTSNGLWYHINEKQINTYVPGLLKKKPLHHIVKQADAWTLSADGLSLMLFFLLVYLKISPLLAAGIAVGFYLMWFFNTSAFVNVALSKIVQVFANDGFMYGVSALLLIGITLNSTIPSLGFDVGVSLSAVWYGIALVFLFKVGLLRLLLRYLASRSKKPFVELNDRVLNMLLIRYGMKYGILTKSVEELQDELIRIANYHKTRKKK